MFAGVSLEGAGIGTQFDLNNAYYKGMYSNQEILAGKVKPPASGSELIRVLNEIK